MLLCFSFPVVEEFKASSDKICFLKQYFRQQLEWYRISWTTNSSLPQIAMSPIVMTLYRYARRCKRFSQARLVGAFHSWERFGKLSVCFIFELLLLELSFQLITQRFFFSVNTKQAAKRIWCFRSNSRRWCNCCKLVKVTHPSVRRSSQRTRGKHRRP